MAAGKAVAGLGILMNRLIAIIFALTCTTAFAQSVAHEEL